VVAFDLKLGDDARDTDRLTRWFDGKDAVFHLASNPDIAAAATNPEIDFTDGTVITASVVEAARRAGIQRIMYASGSGVYGNCRYEPVSESYGPLVPISPYGASKIAGEAMISAYCHMFGMIGVAFRFANVVGPDQTHGVGFDFMNRLRKRPDHLHVLGDGNQSKPYVHVDDVIDAVMIGMAHADKPFDIYNVATRNALTVTEIAEMAMDVARHNCELVYAGGVGGWSGDVPVVRLNDDKIRALGWNNARTSHEAMLDALRSMR
jgi:UDP-glucose 4-epimerase